MVEILVASPSNKRVNLTVASVTPLAGGSVVPAGHRAGKRRAVRPAGYGRRYAEVRRVIRNRGCEHES